MSEITLSNNLAQIELEINHHKQIAGQSIWEIGRRLNHVKEHDLAHGQFGKWLDKVKISHSEARKMMTISKQLSNRSTLNDLGTSALYLIATLPAEAQTEQIQRIESGDPPSVAELKHIKAKYSKAVRRIAELESQQEVKEVVKEVPVVPEDYQQAIQKSKDLSEHIKAYADRNAFLEKTLNDLHAQRAEVDEKSAKYDELTEAIKQSQGQLNSYQRKIASYKNFMSLFQKADHLIMEISGLVYSQDTQLVNVDGLIKTEFNDLVDRGLKLFNDLDQKRKGTEVLEGELL